MSIEVSWGDAEQTIILMKYEDAWTWEDFHNAGMAMDALLGGAVRNTRPNVKSTIIAGSDLYTRSLIEMFRKMNPKAAETWITARSTDEARAIIDRSRAKSRQES
jgi:hypothetical protein